MDKEKTWTSVLASLKTEVSEGIFNTYLKNTHIVDIQENDQRTIFEIGCNSTFIRNTLDLRYHGQIARELSRVTGKTAEVVIKVAEKKIELDEKGTLFETPKATVFSDAWRKANLKADFTFENYAVSGSNQMAYAAAQAVAKKLGETYNPLFIYGGVGVGKTHLMQAIGHEALRNSNGQVLFCSGEEFTNDLVEAIRFKTTDKVRSKYRKVKLLMIDDVQFIAGKPTVQEEFFHTFNAIQRDGGQVVMTSDKPPGEIAKLEERLRSRFGAGLIVDVGPADFELRSAIVLIKAKQRNMEISMETAQTIAANVTGVRELQGALIKLETEERIRGKKLDMEEILKLLNVQNEEAIKSRFITPTEVINQIGNYYGVGVQQLKGEKRTKTIVWPRQILMFILRHDLKLPLEEVGRLLGGRDHTTVLHATDKVRGELDQNHKFAAEMADVKRKIFGGGA